MKHNGYPHVCEDYHGNPILTVKATTIRGAALQAARRGIRDIRIRYREHEKGTTVFRYQAIGRPRPGKFTTEKYSNVKRRGSYHRVCGIAAYLIDTPKTIELVQGGVTMHKTIEVMA